ncbi:MAG: 16S rRNA (cytosine(1402)-N(4))-methyltransferase RsmH [Alphaproteobacteria bacterium]|jgi:16S rRNA (cytosine1402-N4)-methyltransferase|nr:16S rRNA (cytosine(1402)-N(4))-methyltransferase RsmH [Alphaproteobacteria bacterium]
MSNINKNNKTNNKNKNQEHIPVLLQEMLLYLNPRQDGVYVDATFGRGGYSRAILDVKGTRVIAIDRDPDAVKCGQDMENDPTYAGRFTMIEGRFSDLAQNIAQGLRNLKQADQTKVDGVVLDIGVSSPQLDDKSRGFSFTAEAPLDMRMEKSGPSAADLVNSLPEEELANVLYQYGEEKKSRILAKRMVERRMIKPFETTTELSDLICSVLIRGRAPRPDQIHPATRSFQALRIAVNHELDELETVLDESLNVLSKAGRLVVVTFHSLEDRIVKNFMRVQSGDMPNPSRHVPFAHHDQKSFPLVTITKKAIKASEGELLVNPRARSAKLRAAEMVHMREAA